MRASLQGCSQSAQHLVNGLVPGRLLRVVPNSENRTRWKRKGIGGTTSRSYIPRAEQKLTGNFRDAIIKQ